MAEKIIILKCTRCGKEFQRRFTEHKRSIRRGREEFCGGSCASSWVNEHREDNPGYSENLVPSNRRDEYTPFRYFRRKTESHKEHKYSLELRYLKRLWEMQGGIDPITGWKMDLPHGTAGFNNVFSPHNASLDRIDCEEGYVRGNVRYISLITNLCRNRWGDNEIFEFSKAVLGVEDNLDGNDIEADFSQDEWSFKHFIKSSRGRKKHKNNLDLHFLKALWEEQGGICPLTKWNLQLPDSTDKFRDRFPSRSASLDRIDSSIGYVKGNIRYISLIANLTKSSWDDETVVEFARAVVGYNNLSGE